MKPASPCEASFATLRGMSRLVSKNPFTGQVLRELETTDAGALPQLFERARRSQESWAALSTKRRAAQLYDLRETLIDRADSLVELICQENGKPEAEALSNEILPAADSLTYFARKTPAFLKDRPIPMGLMKHRKSYLNYWPVGVVAVISPWNYPFLLPFTQIFMAIAAGNAVIFKPSEVTPLVGLGIQDLFDASGFPKDLLQTVLGDGSVGAGMIRQKPGKIFFTGSVATGKRVMAAAAEQLIPVNLELGGKDAMIVFQDADLDFATSAALWGGFSNSGQVCASTERLLLHESIAEPFIKLLREKTALLRPRASGEKHFDLGPITLEKQKEVYRRQLQEARQKGAELPCGGELSPDGKFLAPTLVSGKGIEGLSIYREETFGPVMAVTTFKTVDEAVLKANDSPYGLLASIIARNTRLAEQVAKRLQVGSVLINEVTYTAGLGETPWGGVKDSGIGRTHSELGLMEYVNVRHIHKPRFPFLRFKSFWWFPYGPHQLATFRELLNLYRRQWFDKARAFPHFLRNLAQFLKKEPRI